MRKRIGHGKLMVLKMALEKISKGYKEMEGKPEGTPFSLTQSEAKGTLATLVVCLREMENGAKRFPELDLSTVTSITRSVCEKIRLSIGMSEEECYDMSGVGKHMDLGSQMDALLDPEDDDGAPPRWH